MWRCSKKLNKLLVTSQSQTVQRCNLLRHPDAWGWNFRSTLIGIFPFIYITCKHSTLIMNVNVVKGMFHSYKTQNVNSWQLCMWMLRGKREQVDPWCKTVAPLRTWLWPGFGWNRKNLLIIDIDYNYHKIHLCNSSSNHGSDWHWSSTTY